MTRWSIPIDELANRANVSIDKVVRKVTFDVFNAVVVRSPVDSGRFRANWNVSLGTPNFATSPAVKAPSTQLSRLNGFPVGNITYLANGLPYARRLEHGWSKQAPQGMVRLSVAEFSRYVRQALAEVK